MTPQRLVQRVSREFSQAFGTSSRPSIAVAPREDHMLRAYASEFGQARELSLELFGRRSTFEPERRSTRGGWFGYVAGVAWTMLGAGHALRGVNLAIAGDVPVGAGLSSSAALEIAVARALAAVSGIPWDPRVAARLGQQAEHEFAGVACGIMDQLSVAAAREGAALLIDCRSLDTRDVPVPATARILVFDSGVRRELAKSAYNDRRAACERVVAALSQRHPWVRALRDADDALLVEVAPALDPVDLRRAAHVVAENQRPARLADAFAAGDLARAGRLMMHSHFSLRDLYEVSSPELDALVELAVEQPGCMGARLTGAGFGGCAIALVEAGSVERVLSSVEAEFERRTGRVPGAFVSQPSAGARIVDAA